MVRTGCVGARSRTSSWRASQAPWEYNGARRQRVVLATQAVGQANGAGVGGAARARRSAADRWCAAAWLDGARSKRGSSGGVCARAPRVWLRRRSGVAGRRSRPWCRRGWLCAPSAASFTAEAGESSAGTIARPNAIVNQPAERCALWPRVSANRCATMARYERTLQQFASARAAPERFAVPQACVRPLLGASRREQRRSSTRTTAPSRRRSGCTLHNCDDAGYTLRWHSASVRCPQGRATDAHDPR